MGMLTKETILKADDLKREQVEVPEWGGHVFVRTMTGLERDRFEQFILDSRSSDQKTNLQNVRARLCSLTMCDEAGKRLFSDDAEMLALGQKSAAALDRVFSVAQKLNHIGKQDVEELAKN